MAISSFFLQTTEQWKKASRSYASSHSLACQSSSTTTSSTRGHPIQKARIKKLRNAGTYIYERNSKKTPRRRGKTIERLAAFTDLQHFLQMHNPLVIELQKHTTSLHSDGTHRIGPAILHADMFVERASLGSEKTLAQKKTDHPLAKSQSSSPPSVWPHTL